jgi:hypothetical protein
VRRPHLQEEVELELGRNRETSLTAAD